MTMTTGHMLAYTNRIKEIEESAAPSNIKDYRLANLMSDLESAFLIPMMRNEEFEESNPHVMQLYRTVSAARSI